MEYTKYFQGSSISAVIRARNKATGKTVRLSEYDAEAIVYTSVFSDKIKLTATESIKTVDEHLILIWLTPEITSKLLPGIYKIRLILVHKKPERA